MADERDKDTDQDHETPTDDADKRRPVDDADPRRPVDDADPRRPVDDADKARDEFAAGVGHMFRAARHAASGLRDTLKSGSHVKETSANAIGTARERVSHSMGEAGKALDDAGRELARAANNVAERISEELSHVGLSPSKDEVSKDEESEGRAPGVADGADWPKTRLEYDRKYGSVGDDWPRSRDEYERRYGAPDPPADPKPPKPEGPTPEDPGFRIATDDD